MDRGAWQAVVHGVTESQICLKTAHTAHVIWQSFVLFCVFNPDNRLQKVIETQSLIRRIDLTVRVWGIVDEVLNLSAPSFVG